MNSIASIATSALNALSVQQDVTAGNVANISTQGFTASTVQFNGNQSGGVSASVSGTSDTVDISREAVKMLATGNAYAANLKALKSGDEMTQTLLDIKK